MIWVLSILFQIGYPAGRNLAMPRENKTKRIQIIKWKRSVHKVERILTPTATCSSDNSDRRVSNLNLAAFSFRASCNCCRTNWVCCCPSCSCNLSVTFCHSLLLLRRSFSKSVTCCCMTIESDRACFSRSRSNAMTAFCWFSCSLASFAFIAAACSASSRFFEETHQRKDKTK